MKNLLRRALLPLAMVLALSACTPAQAEAWLVLHGVENPTQAQIDAFSTSASDWWSNAIEKPEPAAPALAPAPWVIWDDLAMCESTYRWDINTGNGFYGGLQFVQSTWRAFGGQQFATYAHQATREQQIHVAIKVQASQGWGAWPGCARKLGLR